MSIEHKKGWEYYKKMGKYKTYSLNPFLYFKNLIIWFFNFFTSVMKTDPMRALGLGCLHTLIFAPFNLLPVIFISFSGFLYLVSRAHTRSSAIKVGWCFGFGHFLSSLSWIHNALLVEAEQFAYMIPLVLLLLPAVLAIYFAIIAYACYVVTSNRLNRLLMFASLVAISEMARTYFYLPFPWNLTAHSIAYYDYFLQLSFFIGAFGLSFLLSLVGGVFYLRSKRAVIFCLICLICATFFGMARISYSDAPQEIKGYSVRLVQPYNTYHMGLEDRKRESVRTLMLLSLMKRPDDLRYVIWAESAFPYAFYEGSEYIKKLKPIVPKNGMLLFGADRLELKRDKQHSFNIFNSLIGIDDRAETMFVYDKSILVPFGEYIPFRSLLRKMSSVAGGIYDFSVGKGNAIVNVHDLPSFTPFICYETIFPYWGENSSDLLIDITNNIWFGDSIGPHQHFAMVKFKAAEVGKPLLRVANNGISASINKFGLIENEINLNDKSFIDIYIPGGKFDVSCYFLKILISLVPLFVVFFVIYFEKYKKAL